MDNSLSTFIPMDRRHALARNEALPEKTFGSALFADISGFTPLTESLTRTLGPRHGAEELTRQLNRVYDTLIAEIDRYGGSVIAFSGDAITCWFDGNGRASDDPTTALRAVACALSMQKAMLDYASVRLPAGDMVSLAMKATVASGSARRFLVGSAEIQLLDAIGGDTLVRMADAEHLATRGEVLVDEATATILKDRVRILEWRTLEEKHERCAVIRELLEAVEPTPWPPLERPLSDEQERPWLLRKVYEELTSGLGEFLTELRPTVSIFVRFTGINYDEDDNAASKLSTYIAWVQSVLADSEGILVDLTIGDKGSYLYASFGAPTAHEDDPRRAGLAALALRTPPAELSYIEPVQIGISQGTMRTGSFGGHTMRTYGILGDEVNLAARLMQYAQPGEILVSGRVQKAIAHAFDLEPLPPVTVKGKSEPVPLARLLRRTHATTQTISYAGTLVGRDAELAGLSAFIQPIFEKRFAGIAAIYGEAGMGKSRLVYELHRQLAQNHHFNWFNCPAEQLLRQSLHPFKYFLRRYFEQDGANTEDENKAAFDAMFDGLLHVLCSAGDDAICAELTLKRSFLGALVDLHWEGSPYEALPSRLRFANALAAIKLLIVAESKRKPVILYLEDAHWLDADSQEMLNLLLRDSGNHPYVILTSSRYGDEGGRAMLQLPPEVPKLIVDLNALTPQAVRAMAAQALHGDITDELAAFLAEQADGNPFFVEQLALDLHERHLLRERDGVFGLERRDVEVPESINTVLIARLDRLGAQVKAVVQMASVLGHEFEVRILSQMLKDDEHLPNKVKQAEAEVIWSALSDVNYLFRHALLRDAAYDMQVTERIRDLHGLAGQAMEQLYADELDRYAAHLAYHFARAEDRDRELLYARMAGERAATHFANNDAITYLTRALELTAEDQPEERYDLLRLRAQVDDRLGVRKSQTDDLKALSALADKLNDDRRRTQTSLGWAAYNMVTGRFSDAISNAKQAIEAAHQAGIVEDEAEGHIQWGRALVHQADYAAARTHFEQALAVIGDRADSRALTLKADAVRHLGSVAYDLSDYPLARKHLEQALALSREIGDRVDEAATLNHLGNLARLEDRYAEARETLEAALSIRREMGDRRGEEAVLNNLGEVAHDEGNLAGARSYLEQALRISREVEDRAGEGIALEALGKIAGDEGDYMRAQTYLQQSLTLSRAIGDRRDEDQALDDLGRVADEEGDYAHAWAYLEQALKLAREIGDRREESQALAWLGLVFHHLGNDSAAREYCQDALKIAHEAGERAEQATALTILGHALSGLRSSEEAAQAYRQALDLRRELGEEALAVENLAGLARLALAAEKRVEALAHVEPILKVLAQAIPQGVTETILIYLTCYRVLKANDDPRAADVLKQGHELLEQRAQEFPDANQRKQYRELVAAHRELAAAWADQQPSPEGVAGKR